MLWEGKHSKAFMLEVCIMAVHVTGDQENRGQGLSITVRDPSQVTYLCQLDPTLPEFHNTPR